MELKFFSIDEVKDFVKQLKGTRGGKGGDDGDQAPATGAAPAPLQPPQQPAFNPGGFAPPAGGVGAPAGGFPVAAVTGPAPEVVALVNRIVTRIDGAIAGGQPADTVLAWFRTQCGPEAAAADMNAIKTIFLPKAAVPTLENIAKLMNA